MSNFIDNPRMTMTYETANSRSACGACVFGEKEHADWCPHGGFLIDDFLRTRRSTALRDPASKSLKTKELRCWWCGLPKSQCKGEFQGMLDGSWERAK